MRNLSMERKGTTFLLCIVAMTSLSVAGVIHPSLREKMAGSPQTESFTVVARLVDRVDVKALDRDLKARAATRAERHFVVVSALQQKAEATQGSLLSFLRGAASAGLAGELRSYWIENMVEFTASPSVIETVAERQDVEVVFPEPEIFYDPPLDLAYAPEQMNSSEAGLRAIRAPLLWRTGITGAGRIVSNIDTGVKGDHAALASRWRGTLPGIPPQQTWYSGSGSTFPQDSDNPGHGTHTMGTMTGLNAANNDTLGVAPGAYWIAGTSPYTGAFQWVADPDGNPFTVDDVPDVVNCSWFVNATELCSGGSEYWSLMDNVEFAGAVVIWSAGNCGPGGSSGSCTGGATPGPYMTITPPKNRIASDVNAFAVGALDGSSSPYPIASFSSRGPSACDTAVFKPEVAAPGLNVRSTIASGSYGVLSGTSMAAPHVSGSVALLRQINPDADADQIKHALLMSARDLGPVGEDNSYGMGIVDVFAAGELISQYTVSGMITSAGHPPPLPGARVRVVETLQEKAPDSSGSYSVNPILDSVQLTYSAFQHADTTMTVVLQPNAPLTLNVELQPLPAVNVGGMITDSISGGGVASELRWYAEGDPSGGPTYIISSQGNGFYSLSAVVGTYRVDILPPAPHPTLVRVQNVEVTPAGATLNVSLAEAQILLVDDDAGASYDTLYRKAIDRIGLLRRTLDMQDSTISLSEVFSAFVHRPVVLWLTGNDTTNALTAAERSALLEFLEAGGRVILTGQNIAEFSGGGDSLLGGYLGIQYNGLATDAYVRGFSGDVIGNGVSYFFVGGAGNQTSKDILTITNGSVGTPTKVLYYGAPTDTEKIAGVRVLGPGSAWASVFFGFGLEGLAPSRMDTLLVRSLRYFDQLLVSVAESGGGGIPDQFRLDQNYPNPFNPATQIRYGLPVLSSVRLIIYDLLGREVTALVNGVQAAGQHDVLWDGMTAAGAPVSSGAYFCRLEARSLGGDRNGGAVRLRKMLLVR